jgi:hypothetical protein
VIAGYRVWRVIPGKWVSPSESLYAQTCHRNWSLREPTVAYCPPRVQVAPNKPLLVSGCESAPSFGCACGLYARYEPIREDYLLPYVVGSVLAWGRVVHHEGRSFFQGREGPSHSVCPAARGWGNVHQGRIGGQVLSGRRTLGGRGAGGPEELREYTEQEASRW